MSDYTLWLGDCLEEMSRIEDGSVDMICADLRSKTNPYRFRGVLNIVFPNTYNPITQLFHISILGIIKSNSLLLPFVWIWELIWVCVPVIAIKLNNNFSRWYQCVNAKLLSNKALGFILNAYFVQYTITSQFQAVWFKRLLGYIHLNKVLKVVWVIIPTGNRTIFDIPKFLVRGRFLECFTTSNTRVFNLVSPLPLIETVRGAKTGIFAIFRDIKLAMALLTGFIYPIHSFWFRGVVTTSKRAESPSLWHSFSNSLTTKFTGYCSDLVFVHTDIIPQITVTQKPVALLEYLIRTYTNPGELVLDNVFGSCSTGEAALRTGRRFIGIERDEGYYQIGVERMERVAAELRGEYQPKPARGKVEDLPMFEGVTV